MEEKLIKRLEDPVTRLGAFSVRGGVGGVSDDGGGCTTDPASLAFDDLLANYVARVSSAAEKIGGQVLDVTKVVEEAFRVQKELLIQIKKSQKHDMAGLAEFLKPLNEVIMKAHAMTEGNGPTYLIT